VACFPGKAVPGVMQRAEPRAIAEVQKRALRTGPSAESEVLGPASSCSPARLLLDRLPWHESPLGPLAAALARCASQPKGYGVLCPGKRCLFPDTGLLWCAALHTNKVVLRISCIFTSLISSKPFRFISGENRCQQWLTRGRGL